LVRQYFASQWAIGAQNVARAPYLLVNLFWAAYNLLFLYGVFMFRVEAK
jgi:hypothetical protein